MILQVHYRQRSHEQGRGARTGRTAVAAAATATTAAAAAAAGSATTMMAAAAVAAAMPDDCSRSRSTADQGKQEGGQVGTNQGPSGEEGGRHA